MPMFDTASDCGITQMNHVDRFRSLMSFQAVDRYPRWEWAMWWDETIARWKTEGLPTNLNGVFEIAEYFGLDPYRQFWFSTTDPTIEAVQHHVEGIVSNMDDYLRIRPNLFPDHTDAINSMAPWLKRQENGDVVVWITIEGFFWFPRTLMGFNKVCLAFYDQPELIHKINSDLTEFNLKLLEQIQHIGKPVFTTIAEDMSYNHGPMISEKIFDEFVAPYYRKIVPRLQEMGSFIFADTDGDVTLMVPWLLREGINGVLPLERQAGVDAMALRNKFPELLMIGHYNKMVMNKGVTALENEFERIVPIVKQGGFIPSVDHQTPPGVSLDEYRLYLKYLEKYTNIQ
ncbi:MAG: uroporphyrinogen decarboxylase family protein [Thermoguttaceae bacterium]